jgi:hypothetical protein
MWCRPERSDLQDCDLVAHGSCIRQGHSGRSDLVPPAKRHIHTRGKSLPNRFSFMHTAKVSTCCRKTRGSWVTREPEAIRHAHGLHRSSNGNCMWSGVKLPVRKASGSHIEKYLWQFALCAWAVAAARITACMEGKDKRMARRRIEATHAGSEILLEGNQQ